MPTSFTIEPFEGGFVVRIHERGNPTQFCPTAQEVINTVYGLMFDSGVTDPKAYESLRVARANLVLQSIN